MRILRYATSGGKDLIMEYIDALPTEDRILGYIMIEDFETKGMEAFKYYETRVLKKPLYEIKINKNRYAYLLVDGETLVILHAFKKEKNKTEKPDLDLALKRMKSILKGGIKK